MKYIFDVAFLPSEVFKDHDVRIVVDLLRATTQITTFFDGGGSVLVPLKEVEAAFEMKERLGKDWKIMGERGGLPAPGFDFGNSPLELLEAGVPEFAIITTSNGTRALMRAAEGCGRVLAGCARNAEAVCWDALCSGNNVGIICAGRNGDVGGEAAGPRPRERRGRDGAHRRRDVGDGALAPFRPRYHGGLSGVDAREDSLWAWL